MESLDCPTSQHNHPNEQDVDDEIEHYNRRQLVFGPILYCGPRPSMACELYVTNLPTSLDVPSFLNWLNRLGPVFEMRLMMNTENSTRGYCFIRFFQEQTAIAALELLCYLFLNGKRPNAQISQCKRQLFVSGIPKMLTTNQVREGFHKLFGYNVKCTVYPQSECTNAGKNRGFAFLDFVEHDEALDAKKFLKHNRMWNQIIRVDWARPNMVQTMKNSSTQLSPNLYVRKNDYSAKLRLYALANNWFIPIIVYGSNIKKNGIQYGGILLKDAATANYSCIIVEMVGIVFDVHILMCEIATHLVEVIRGLPKKHYIIRARYGTTAKILYSFVDLSEVTEQNITLNILMSPLSVYELMTSLEILAQYNSEAILNYYKLSFRSESANMKHIAKFALIEGHKLSHFYSIYPKFRGNYPLNNNFNDTEIVLLQAYATSDNEACIKPEIYFPLLNAKTPDEGAFLLKSQRYNRHDNYYLNFVDIEGLKTCAFYSPMQQLNTPPLWISGKSYQASLYETD